MQYLYFILLTINLWGWVITVSHTSASLVVEGREKKWALPLAVAQFPWKGSLILFPPRAPISFSLPLCLMKCPYQRDVKHTAHGMGPAHGDPRGAGSWWVGWVWMGAAVELLCVWSSARVGRRLSSGCIHPCIIIWPAIRSTSNPWGSLQSGSCPGT